MRGAQTKRLRLLGIPSMEGLGGTLVTAQGESDAFTKMACGLARPACWVRRGKHTLPLLSRYGRPVARRILNEHLGLLSVCDKTERFFPARVLNKMTTEWPVDFTAGTRECLRYQLINKFSFEGAEDDGVHGLGLPLSLRVQAVVPPNV
jgi:hypothetical protein